jgi:hypothetical protein
VILDINFEEMKKDKNSHIKSAHDLKRYLDIMYGDLAEFNY